MEAVAVFAVALVESENLLVKVAEQMKRPDGNISTFEAALEERPKVLNAVRVNLAVNVLFRVVNDLVNVLLVKPAVSPETAREEFRARLDVAPDYGVKRKLSGVTDNLRPHLAVALKKSHDGDL